MRSPAIAAVPLAFAVLGQPAPGQGEAPRPTPELAEVAAAYAAKVVASAVFVSGRTLDSVLAQELAPDRPLEAMIRPLLQFEIDAAGRSATCRLGAATAVAVATGNLGCTLVRADATASALRRRAAPALADIRADPATVDWPLGDRIPAAPPPSGVDQRALAQAVAAAFAEPAAGPKVRTRAVVVVHRGRLLAERYAEGFGPDMPLPGWSMTKTMVNALVGRRVLEGKLDLEAPLQLPERSGPAATQHVLRLGDLLGMTSGLRWREDYDDPDSDALRMLFRSSDHGAVQAAQPSVAAPGTAFCYSSGSTNLACRVVRGTFATDQEYWASGRQLFLALGMRSAVLETDPSGTFVGSSYGFASARDWARFGMLYAQDGVWNGQRLLPAGWVAASARAVPASAGRYGRHLWLDADPDGDGPRQRAWADLPADLLRMDGHQGQYVTVLPREQLVVVRLGCTKNGGFDLHGLVRRVWQACGGTADAK